MANTYQGQFPAKDTGGGLLTAGGKQMANTWQGAFPHQNLKLDGYERTSPVTAFPPNAYGVYNMIGNVWEWTDDWYSAKHEAEADKACCIPTNPRVGPRSLWTPRPATLVSVALSVRG